MKKNFLNDLNFKQEVYVLDDYQPFEGLDFLEKYHFNSFLPPSRLDSYLPLSHRQMSADFWKKNLEEEFILEENFHRDLLYNALETSLENWANYKQIPTKEFMAILKKQQEIENNSNQMIEDEGYYKMKVNSPFNEQLFFGVTPEAMENIEKTYSLQDAHSLYTELAKLEVFDFRSLYRFSKHFGMPYGIMDDNGFDLYLDGDTLFFPFCSIAVLNKKIAIYKRDFEWFKIIQTKNMSKIRSLLYNTDAQDNISDDDVIDQAKEHITSLLSRLDAFNISMYVDYQDGSFVPGVWFSDLFNFAYFQLAKALSNNIEVRECDYCGHIFEVTHKRQRFCPPLPNRKRSSCEMAYNNRLKKEKK